MENLFQLLVDAHGLSAWIQPIDIDELNGTVQPEMIHKLLADEKVIFGVSEEVIQRICKDPFTVEYPIPIAKGVPAENGSDAYLLNEVSFDRKTGRSILTL
ncbi:FapA family protein [Cytobacillus firmus]|uniref:flagellar assembly protein A n=1 Tax=Cytobacillus firmus TaxID=1399 RepID=UPI002079E416|nr:flagellar assembly protein A [Cytobacillus firmus]USK40678.1 FapA family protein [Cytobacillus firmus]